MAAGEPFIINFRAIRQISIKFSQLFVFIGILFFADSLQGVNANILLTGVNLTG